MDMKVIGMEKRLCTCCMEEHDVKTVRVKERKTFKNTSISFKAEYYYCDVAQELYMDEAMISANDVRMKDAYRKSAGLLTSSEISDIRAKYLITQSDLCILLGWGGKTITRYESHQVQDKAHDTILKKLNQDSEWFLQLLYESKKTLSATAYKKYLEIATIIYENDQDNYLRKSIEAKYARLRNNELYNGNVQLSLDKVVDMICYFANSSDVTNLYKVKLMKLMWYADFLAYKKRGFAITGLVYQALAMGAVPVGHDSIIDLKGIPCEEIDMGDGTAYRFHASSNKQYPSLLDEDKIILNTVIEKFGKMNKVEIVNFMHEEQAYKNTAQREFISYKYAKDLLI